MKLNNSKLKWKMNGCKKCRENRKIYEPEGFDQRWWACKNCLEKRNKEIKEAIKACPPIMKPFTEKILTIKVPNLKFDIE